MFVKSGGPIRKGLLIDFDYSDDMNVERKKETRAAADKSLTKRILLENTSKVVNIPALATHNKGVNKGKAADAKIQKRNIDKLEKLLMLRGQRTVCI